MSRNLLFIFLFSAFLSRAQQVPVIKFEQLQKIINNPSSSIQVINFWATWCAPCVKELPQFEKLNAQKNPEVKVTLVNLDFADRIEKVNSFVARRKLKSEIVLLDEIDYNEWIDKVDKSWNGSIPATLIINHQTGKRKFVEKELQDGELEKLIREIL